MYEERPDGIDIIKEQMAYENSEGRWAFVAMGIAFGLFWLLFL